MLRRTFVLGSVGAPITLIRAQGPITPLEIRGGEILIGIISPLITDDLKKLIDAISARGNTPDAKKSLTALSEQLGYIDAARVGYIASITTYLADLDRQNTNTGRPPNSIYRAEEDARELIVRLKRLDTLIGQIDPKNQLFDKDTKQLFETYINSKGETITEIPKLANESQSDRTEFQKKLNSNSEDFGVALQALRDGIKNKAG